MPDVTQTATAPWEWQKGTKVYDPFAGLTPQEKILADMKYGNIKLRPDAQKTTPGINYQNATNLIGTNAADALYGAWLHPFAEGKYDSIGGIRGSATQENAQITRNLLRQMYPSATQEQLDTAAANALAKRGEHWNEEINPTDIVRAIGTEMGGIPQTYAEKLASLDPQFDKRREQIRSARNKSDDASSGLKGMIADLGPIAPIALGIALPGIGSALGMGAMGTGALVGGTMGAISGGDLKSALKGAALGGAGGALGQYAGGLEGTTAGISNTNLANTLGKAGLNIVGGADPSKALLGAGTSLAGSAGTNYLTDQGWNPNLASAAVGAGLTGLQGGDVSDYLTGQALKYGTNQAVSGAKQLMKSGTDNVAALPANQVSALGDDTMSDAMSYFSGNNPDEYDIQDITDYISGNNPDEIPGIDLGSGVDVSEDSMWGNYLKDVGSLPQGGEIEDPTYQDLAAAFGPNAKVWTDENGRTQIGGGWNPANIGSTINTKLYDQKVQTPSGGALEKVLKSLIPSRLQDKDFNWGDALLAAYGMSRKIKGDNASIEAQNQKNKNAQELFDLYKARTTYSPAYRTGLTPMTLPAAQSRYATIATPTQAPVNRAQGGPIPGALSQVTKARYVRGGSGGQDDNVSAMLSPGEYVFDADAVSALGDGNNEAGAAKLDKMRENLRSHKRSAPATKIPPKAKAPEKYLKGQK